MGKRAKKGRLVGENNMGKGGVGRQPEREERWSRRGRGSEEEGEDFPAALLLTEVSAQPSHNQKRRYLTPTTVR